MYFARVEVKGCQSTIIKEALAQTFAIGSQIYDIISELGERLAYGYRSDTEDVAG